MDEFEKNLTENMQLFSRFPRHIQEVILKFVPLFLKNKEFIGKNDLTICDRHKVVIAGNAALVGATQKVACFSSVRWILVYPNIVHIDGEAFDSSKVILSWECVIEESRNLASGSNLVVHEFAHVLDHLLGISHGDIALQEAFEVNRDNLIDYGESFFNEHAIDSPQEFFASSSEAFFTQPNSLNREFPGLYHYLSRLYGLDMRLYLAA